MKVFKLSVSVFCFLFLQLFGNSLQLYNDSNSYLLVKVVAADSTVLGETVMAPLSWNNWNDEDLLNPQLQNPTYSMTPYIVHWYCLDGSEFSICTGVSPGMTIIAQNCPGNCLCKQKEVKRNQGEPNSNSFSNPPQYPPESEEQNSSSGQ